MFRYYELTVRLAPERKKCRPPTRKREYFMESSPTCQPIENIGPQELRGGNSVKGEVSCVSRKPSTLRHTGVDSGRAAPSRTQCK